MPESKKVVIKVDIHEDKDKRKALKAVSGVLGIESLAIDLKDQKLTITGDMDPLLVVKKLKKWHTEILTLGPAKEPEKKPEEKKPEEKKPEEKKPEEKKPEVEEAVRRFIETQRAYNPCMCMNQRYCVHLVEEDHRVCVIL